uniref:N-sulphoglucosamine sulphohydrolase C-terminal domain-containing protein n=1 Tax=Biomphalaria glabrata TaxID=6526 RepID=A0A2C9LWR7_BIOGL
QFSLPYDKRQFYDFDIQVPLMVRGPDVKPNSTCQESVMSVDLAPTILDLANLPPPSVFDGSTFKPILHGQPHTYRATVLVEYHGEQVDLVNNCPKYNGQGLAQCDTHCVCRDSWNNTYGCIRYETQQNSYKYCALQDTD